MVLMKEKLGAAIALCHFLNLQREGDSVPVVIRGERRKVNTRCQESYQHGNLASAVSIVFRQGINWHCEIRNVRGRTRRNAARHCQTREPHFVSMCKTPQRCFW